QACRPGMPSNRSRYVPRSVPRRTILAGHRQSGEVPGVSSAQSPGTRGPADPVRRGFQTVADACSDRLRENTNPIAALLEEERAAPAGRAEVAGVELPLQLTRISG